MKKKSEKNKINQQDNDVCITNHCESHDTNDESTCPQTQKLFLPKLDMTWQLHLEQIKVPSAESKDVYQQAQVQKYLLYPKTALESKNREIHE